MSGNLQITVDSVTNLQRPERKLFDRVRECVVKTTATAPEDDSGSDLESGDESGGEAPQAPPAYVKKVIFELQVANELWQTKPFDVIGTGVKSIAETLKSVTPPAPGSDITIRALKLHRFQKHALIGEGKFKAVHGARIVKLMRKGKERGTVRLQLADPTARSAPARSPSPREEHRTEETASVAASSTDDRTPVVGGVHAHAEDDGPLREAEGDDDPTIALLKAEEGMSDGQDGSTRSIRYIAMDRGFQIRTSIEERWRSVPSSWRRNIRLSVTIILPLLLVYFCFRTLVNYLTAPPPPGGAQPADTPGLLDLSPKRGCVKLIVRDVQHTFADDGQFFSFERGEIEGLTDGGQRRMVLTNRRTGLRSQVVMWGKEAYEGSPWGGHGSYDDFDSTLPSIKPEQGQFQIGDRLSSCDAYPFARQLSTQWGIDSSCLDYDARMLRGRNVRMAKCNHGQQQQFYWDETGERLKVMSDETLCLTWRSGEKPGNTYMSNCNDDANQKWYWDGAQLRSRYNDFCMDFDWWGAFRGPHRSLNNVYTRSCLGARSQEWYFHKNNAHCDTDVAANRGKEGTQVARRCLPTYVDDQKVSAFVVEVSLNMGPGNYHTAIRFRGDCPLINRPFVGYDSAPGAKTIAELPDGVRTEDADECCRQCADNCCCNAWVWASDYEDRTNCFLLQRNLGVGRANNNRVFGYLQSRDGDNCVREVVDYSFGALHFGKDGSLMPNHVDVEAGNVRYNDRNIEVSFMVQRPCPEWWFWDHSVTNVGQLTGKQVNALSDWTSVPNHRPDISPVQPQDNNYMSTAVQYNFNGAYSRAPPYGDGGNYPLEYIPSSKCDDYVWSVLKWTSSNLGVVLKPLQDGAFCYGEGCSRRKLKHSLFGIFVTGPTQPKLIGANAGRECAEWWAFLHESSMELTQSTTVESALDSIKNIAKELVFGKKAKKTCIYKNYEWWNTPLNLLSGDFLAWGMNFPPWYQHTPYSCPALSHKCFTDECALHGFGLLRSKKDVCVNKADYWSARPLNGFVDMGRLLKEDEDAAGASDDEASQFSVDRLYELVFEKLMQHVDRTLKELHDKSRVGYTDTFEYSFNPFTGFLSDHSKPHIGGPYTPKTHAKAPATEAALDRWEEELRAEADDASREASLRAARAKEAFLEGMAPLDRDVTAAKMLETLATAMRPYRATPWCKLQPHGGDPSWHAMDYRDFPLPDKAATQNRREGKMTLTNAHAGDLLEHSKWTALQTAIWIKNQDAWTEGLDQRLVILGSFLHDLGKAGDCAFTCIKNPNPDKHPRIVETAKHDHRSKDEHCYLDTYSTMKFKNQDDIIHPVYSAMYLQTSSKSLLWLQCPSDRQMQEMWHSTLHGNTRHSSKWTDAEMAVSNELEHWKEEWLSHEFAETRGMYLTANQIRESLNLSPLEEYKLMIAARMHWDLGRMNMPAGSKMYLDADGYLKKLAAVMASFAECDGPHRGTDCVPGPDGGALFECKNNKQEVLNILRLCIAIAAADISGGSPSRESSRAGTSEVNFVSDGMNGALQLCMAVDGKKGGFQGLSATAVTLVQEVCQAGCHDDEGDICALRQRYPGLDVWTAFGFEPKGLGYREALLTRFHDIASNSHSYEAWCDSTMSDLAEMPRIKYSAFMGSGSSGWRTMYVRSLPLTGEEKGSCGERVGFVEGVCVLGDDGRCKQSDLVVPCSKSTRMTLTKDERRKLKIPDSATRSAFIYNCENDAFNLGGFVYFDNFDNIVAVNYIIDRYTADGKDDSAPLSFSEPREAPKESYNALRSILNDGVTALGPAVQDKFVQAEVERYAWVPPGVLQEAPHGGIGYLVK